MRNNHRAEGVSSAWLLATKWCAVFSLRLLSISVPSICSRIFVLFLWFWHHGIIEDRVSRKAHREEPVSGSYLFGWILSAHLSVCFNTGAPERWAFSLLVISGLIPSYLEGAWHITGIYQHSLGGGTVVFLQKEERIWGHLESLLIGNEAVLLFVLYFTMMITCECN